MDWPAIDAGQGVAGANASLECRRRSRHRLDLVSSVWIERDADVFRQWIDPAALRVPAAVTVGLDAQQFLCLMAVNAAVLGITLVGGNFFQNEWRGRRRRRVLLGAMD